MQRAPHTPTQPPPLPWARALLGSLNPRPALCIPAGDAFDDDDDLELGGLGPLRPMEDGQVRADHAWARRLRRAIADEPLAGSLIAACASLASVGIDIDLLEEIFRRQERDWRRQRKLEGLGLPDSFMNFALAIYVYTLEDPAVYTVVNRAMYNPARRSAHGVLPGPDLSPELQACLPYIRFLDTALERLPEAFIFRGRVHRGVRSPPRRARTRTPRLIEYTRNPPPIPPE